MCYTRSTRDHAVTVTVSLHLSESCSDSVKTLCREVGDPGAQLLLAMELVGMDSVIKLSSCNMRRAE
jgi:hypothetical protein